MQPPWCDDRRADVAAAMDEDDRHVRQPVRARQDRLVAGQEPVVGLVVRDERAEHRPIDRIVVHRPRSSRRVE